MKTPRHEEMSDQFLEGLGDLVRQLDLEGALHQPRGRFYVGTGMIAVVVPRGIDEVLQFVSTLPFVSEPAILKVLRMTDRCLDFGGGQTICRARILYRERQGIERVNVILIPWYGSGLPLFDGGIECFDLHGDFKLRIDGFNSISAIRRVA